MAELGLILSGIYALIAITLAFIIIYPMLKDMSKDILTSKGSADAVALFGALMAMGAGALMFMFMITAFISAGFVLISIFSGFELIHWTKTHKINLSLFIVSLILSAFSLVAGKTVAVIYLVQGGIYLTGVVEGANKHLLPIVRDVYADFGSESYAEAFVALSVVLCILTIALPFLGVDVPYGQTPQILSDVGFLGGGLMAYYLGRLIRRKRTARTLY